MFEVVSLNARTGQKVSTQRVSFLPLPFLFSRTRITMANGFGQTIASKDITGYPIADGWKEPNYLMWVIISFYPFLEMRAESGKY